MDSEHRHELEENTLAVWLADKIEAVKPQLPAIGIGIVVLIAGLIGLNGWKASAAGAKADRWRDFSNALEGATPKLDLLQKAANDHPDTAVAEWSEITWADAKLFEASTNFFRNRSAADTAVEEAIEVYDRLVDADDRNVSERANFQLGRAYELQGKLDDAAKQYARVTGAFAQVAQERAEELESNKVKSSYEWITATKTASASATIDPAAAGLTGDLEPDDLALPDTEEDADAMLDDLLGEVEAETASQEAADDAAESSESDDSSESIAEEIAEEASESADKE